MSFLVRKITKAKWVVDDRLGSHAISADAVTSCLRTKANALSVWECHGPERPDVLGPVLALAAELERLDSIQVVAISRSSLEASGVALEATPGSTPVADLVPTHRDLVRLHLDTLGALARVIAAAVRQETTSYQFSKKQVRDLIIGAIRARRVDIVRLKPCLREDIERAIESGS